MRVRIRLEKLNSLFFLYEYSFITSKCKEKYTLIIIYMSIQVCTTYQQSGSNKAKKQVNKCL